ncbi:ankyrin repeat domain-containing protein [Gordonia paraffinivorans]|uniref:ankyrin repeat domain-containing protein n=1 Tax=Gordonia paraffinivorans TaxID=175628 RepID=UPI001444D255
MAGVVHVVVALCEVVVSGFGMRGARRHTLVVTPRSVAAVGHSNARRMNRPSGEAADGADVNAREARGWTPLHFAAQQTHVEVVKKPINAGAAVDAVSDLGETPSVLPRRRADVQWPTTLYEYSAARAPTEQT